MISKEIFGQKKGCQKDPIIESLFCLQQPTVWPSSGRPVCQCTVVAWQWNSSQSYERSNEVVSRQPKDQSDGA